MLLLILPTIRMVRVVCLAPLTYQYTDVRIVDGMRTPKSKGVQFDLPPSDGASSPELTRDRRSTDRRGERERDRDRSRSHSRSRSRSRSRDRNDRDDDDEDDLIRSAEVASLSSADQDRKRRRHRRRSNRESSQDRDPNNEPSSPERERDDRGRERPRRARSETTPRPRPRPERSGTAESAHSDSTEDLPPRFDGRGNPVAQRGDDPLADKVEDMLSGKGTAGGFLKRLTGDLFGGDDDGRRRRRR